MKLTKMITLAASIIFGLGLSYPVMAEDGATIDEVTAKVKEAAAAIAKAADKEAAIKEFEGKSKTWAWKDTYVFVFTCKGDKAIAHPTLAGKTIMDLKDKADNFIFGGDTGLCKAAEQADGGWSVYMWPKKAGGDPSAKATFAMKVEGTDYEVAAGIYAEKKVENFQLK